MATERNDCKGAVRVGNACCAVALSLMLAGQAPVCGAAFADTGVAAENGTAGDASSQGVSAPGASPGTVGAVESATAAATDVSADWAHGGLALSRAGRYVLSADVKDAGMLSIAVGEGEEIELDLAGHTVEFASDVACGIDLSASKGTVRIVDSAPRYIDAQRGKTADNLAACLKMQVADSAENVCGVRLSAAKRTQDQTASKVELSDVAISLAVRVSTEASLERDVAGVFVETAGDAAPDDVDFSLARCAVSVSVEARDAKAEDALSIGGPDQPETGMACALYTGCKGVAIDGSASFAASGLGSAVDLASTVDDAFCFGRDYESAQGSSANVRGNADGAILGHAVEGFEPRNLDRLAFSAPEAAGGSSSDAVFSLDDANRVVIHRAAGAGNGATRTATASGAFPATAVGTSAETATEGGVVPSSDPVLAQAEEQSVSAIGEGIFGRRALESQVELQVIGDARNVASLVRDGKVKGSYATVDDAMSHMASGDTLRLDADIDNLVFAQAGNTLVSYAIDLAGHTAGSVTVSSQAAVSIASSEAGGTIGGSSNGGAALTYSGGGRLAVEGVSVSNYSGSTKAWGVVVTGVGGVTLTDVDIAVSAQGTEARGIYQTSKSGGAIIVRGGSVDVSTSAAGVAAYGITSVAQSRTLSFEDCPISVHGGTAAACGIDSKGVVSVKGTSSQAKVSVQATEASASMWGIRAASASSSIWLTDCAVSVAAQNVPEGVQAWCVTTGDAGAQNAVAITLDGDCSFDSCTDTDINMCKTPIQLGDAFSAAPGAITVGARGLTGDVFAVRTKANAQAAGFAKSFKAVPGSEYDGWTAEVPQEAAQKLAWHHAAVAKNGRTGVEYGSFSQAVSQAKSGDTVTLTSNATVRGALEVTQQDLTIELGSHTLTVEAEGEAQGTAKLTKGAVAFSGKGTLTVKGGTLALNVGRAIETSSSAANPYQGFAVSGGGELVLSGCSATVCYTGSTTTDPEVKLYGVSNASGTFRLANSSKLAVRAAGQSGRFGASSVCGLVGASAKQSDAISVDASSSVTVENNASALVQGRIAYPDGVLTGTNSSSNADLIELAVDANSDLYNEIQQQFKACAKFDSNLDENGKVRNTGIYYATSMSLPSGLTVWAFSDPVSAENAGKIGSIAATHFFVCSDYQVALDAYGVTSTAAYAGEMNVEGSVSATTSQGHAYGAYLPKGANWNVTDARVSARSTGGEYRARVGKFDLSKHISFAEGVTGAVVYPSDASYREVARVKPQAAKVAREESAAEEEIAGGVTYDSLFAGMKSPVAITFSNIRSASGASLSQTVSATRGKTLSASGARVPTPADYTVGDVTYRFVGWRLSSASSSSYAIDPAALSRDIVVDANLEGVAEGNVSLAASYVPVKKGQRLVRFRVEYGVYAMAADDGAAPTFSEAAGLAENTAPSRITSVSSSQYAVTFKGWAADSSGAYDYVAGETVYPDAVPAVRGDVTYSARFESAVATTPLALYYLRLMSDGTYAYSRESIKGADWRHDAIDIANERAKVGQTIVQNGVSYTLLGWSPRISDKEPLYTDTLPLSNDGDILSEKPTFYAVYKQEEKTYTVNFYVNGSLYSTAENVTASTTLYNVWNASSNATEPVPAKADETFKGWNADEKASTYYRASMKKVGEIATSDGADSINLYAIWSSATDNKTPDDANGGGKADAGANGSGSDTGADGGSGADGAGSGSGAALASSSGSGAALANALKPSAGDGAADAAEGEDAEASASGATDDGDLATSALAGESEGAAAADSGSVTEGENASDAAGVIGVIVAALAAIGAAAWWFMRRRAGDVAEDEDDLPAPDETDGAPKAVAEGIRF